MVAKGVAQDQGNAQETEISPNPLAEISGFSFLCGWITQFRTSMTQPDANVIL